MNKSQKIKELENYLPDLIEKVLKEHGDEFYGSKSILRSKAQYLRHKEAVYNRLSLKEYSEDIALVFRIIHKYLERVTTNEEAAQVFMELKNSEDSLRRFYESEEEKEGFISYREILGYSELTMQCCYRLGVAIFHKKEYFYAFKLFSFLLLLTPAVPQFWSAAGISLKKQEDYSKALRYFEEAMKLFPSEFSFPIHAAECFIKLGDHARAKEELAKGSGLIGEKDKKVWGETLQMLKEVIKKKEQQ